MQLYKTSVRMIDLTKLIIFTSLPKANYTLQLKEMLGVLRILLMGIVMKTLIGLAKQ